MSFGESILSLMSLAAVVFLAYCIGRADGYSVCLREEMSKRGPEAGG